MQIDQSCYPTPESFPRFVRLARIRYALHLVARVVPPPEGNALRSLQRGMRVLSRGMNVGCDADVCVCVRLCVCGVEMGECVCGGTCNLRQNVLELPP